MPSCTCMYQVPRGARTVRAGCEVHDADAPCAYINKDGLHCHLIAKVGGWCVDHAADRLRDLEQRAEKAEATAKAQRMSAVNAYTERCAETERADELRDVLRRLVGRIANQGLWPSREGDKPVHDRLRVDWACAECVGEDEETVKHNPGFRCAWHRAVALVGLDPPPSPEQVEAAFAKGKEARRRAAHAMGADASLPPPPAQQVRGPLMLVEVIREIHKLTQASVPTPSGSAENELFRRLGDISDITWHALNFAGAPPETSFNPHGVREATITVQGPVVTNPEWAEAALKLTAEALDGAPKDRTPVVHDLKIWPEFFEPVVDGRKTFELRRDDRGYRVGEVLRLREFHIEGGKGKYTGREVERVITYVSQQGAPFLQPGYVALGLGEPPVAVSALAGPGADLIDTTSTAKLDPGQQKRFDEIKANLVLDAVRKGHMFDADDVRAALGWPVPATVYESNGEPCTPTLRGHTFGVSATDKTGRDSGRRRWRVECKTCDVVLHEATTGAATQMAYHLNDVEERRA
jgi:hypothetical protein